MPITLPPASEVLAGPAPDHEEQYADDPTALPPAAPAQDDWPLGVDAAGNLNPSAPQPDPEPPAPESPTPPAACTIPLRIRDLRERVRLTSAQLAEATENRKECKRAHQDALAALMKALNETSLQSSAVSPQTLTTEGCGLKTDPEAWRSFELARLDLSPSIVQSLAEQDLTTMGQLCDFTNAGKLLTDLKKIGKGKAEKIELACERFWAEHPEFSEGEAGEELSEQEAAGLAGEGEDTAGVSDEAYEGL